MVAFFGEKALRTESALAESRSGGDCLISESTWTGRLVVSVCARHNKEDKKTTENSKLYFICLVNRHIHLIQQLIHFFQRVIFKSDAATAVFSVPQLYFCTEMR